MKGGRRAGPAQSVSRAVISATMRATGRSMSTFQPLFLARVQRFEGLQLAVQQRGRHEVALAGAEPARQDRLVAVEHEELDFAQAGGEPVAIVALQRRAGQDDGLARHEVTGQRLVQGGQPGPAVLVVQRLAPRHLLDVGARVEVVGVQEAGAEPARDLLADGGLAAAADAPDDDGQCRERRGRGRVGRRRLRSSWRRRR